MAIVRFLPFEYAVRNLGRSRARLFGSVFGSGMVVLLIIAAGGFVRGMNKNMAISGSERNVILLGAGSEESLERSQISMNVPTLVAASVPGIRERMGERYVSGEVHMALVVKRSVEADEQLKAVLRGVTPTAYLVHPQVRIIEGRAPRPGEYELLVGELTATRLGIPGDDLAIGKTLWFDNRDWTITGRFAAPQTVMNAEIWVPLTDLQIATRRDTLSCVVLTLDEATFQDVSVWCAQRLDLELVAMTEREYYAGLARFFGPVRAIVWVTAGLIALGGVFGGLNTLYAAFAARVRELGTLQTLGFSRRAIAVSFVQESLVATLAGELAAVVVGLLLLDGLAVRISMGAFALNIDQAVVLGGLAGGMCLAIAGVVLPLVRCLRLPIVEALRAG